MSHTCRIGACYYLLSGRLKQLQEVEVLMKSTRPDRTGLASRLYDAFRIYYVSRQTTDSILVDVCVPRNYAQLNA